MNLSFLSLEKLADLLEKKINEVKKVSGIVEKLDSHYVFLMLKNCFNLPKLLFFLRTTTLFIHPALLAKYDKTVRDGLSKVCNVNFDDISSTQLALPTEIGGFGVSSASLLALAGFLDSDFGASDFLTTIFSEIFKAGLSRNSRDSRSRLEKCQFETGIEKKIVEKSRIEK